MEQKDYLMREIEKIGLLLRAMLGSLLNLKDDLTSEIQFSFGEAMERLLDETGFHPEMFLALDELAAREYLSGFNGFNTPNLELLAEVFFQLGKTGQPDNRKYLDKALLLFEWCNDRDKTFSGPRESRIGEIKSLLSTIRSSDPWSGLFSHSRYQAFGGFFFHYCDSQPSTKAPDFILICI